jgi:Tfp pilus assembly protein PilZ
MVGATVFALRLLNAQELVRVYDRDVRSGGLFIRTPNPAPIDDRITVELHLPPPSPGPLFFGAKVVHCFNPPAGAGVNLLPAWVSSSDGLPAVLTR